MSHVHNGKLLNLQFTVCITQESPCAHNDVVVKVAHNDVVVDNDVVTMS